MLKSKYFTIEGDRLACPHCHECHMDPDFMFTMDWLRGFVGFAIQGTSGYRCPWYNAQLSPIGSTTGPHTTGLAMDVSVSGSYRVNNLIEAVFFLRHLLKKRTQLTPDMPTRAITGIGLKQHGKLKSRCIHLDSCPSIPRLGRPRPLIWTYS